MHTAFSIIPLISLLGCTFSSTLISRPRSDDIIGGSQDAQTLQQVLTSASIALQPKESPVDGGVLHPSEWYFPDKTAKYKSAPGANPRLFDFGVCERADGSSYHYFGFLQPKTAVFRYDRMKGKGIQKGSLLIIIRRIKSILSDVKSGGFTAALKCLDSAEKWAQKK